MIKVSVLYPNTEGKRFDHDYYANKHCAMIADKVGSALLKKEIDKGVAGMPPGQPAPFVDRRRKERRQWRRRWRDDRRQPS